MWLTHFNPLSPHGERRGVQTGVGAIRADFNPLSPHGERPIHVFQRVARRCISIHSPHTGRDQQIDHNLTINMAFQSTLPTRGETLSTVCTKAAIPAYFNPLSPHGERPPSVPRPASHGYFNPLSPHGERRDIRCLTAVQTISIHSPHTGRDLANMGLYNCDL